MSILSILKVTRNFLIGAQSELIVPDPRLAAVVLATEEQIQKLENSPGNGLESRIKSYLHECQIYADQAAASASTARIAARNCELANKR